MTGSTTGGLVWRMTRNKKLWEDQKLFCPLTQTAKEKRHRRKDIEERGKKKNDDKNKKESL